VAILDRRFVNRVQEFDKGVIAGFFCYRMMNSGGDIQNGKLSSVENMLYIIQVIILFYKLNIGSLYQHKRTRKNALKAET